MIRKANATWRGAGTKGTGSVTTESGALAEVPYSFSTRFEGERGTNPEELIGAAHAGCFAMALAVELEGAGFEPEELRVEAAVVIEKTEGGFSIERSDLKLAAKVPGIEREQFEKMAQGAKTNCPVSKALGVEIALEWSLA